MFVDKTRHETIRGSTKVGVVSRKVQESRLCNEESRWVCEKTNGGAVRGRWQEKRKTDVDTDGQHQRRPEEEWIDEGKRAGPSQVERLDTSTSHKSGRRWRGQEKGCISIMFVLCVEYELKEMMMMNTIVSVSSCRCRWLSWRAPPARSCCSKGNTSRLYPPPSSPCASPARCTVCRASSSYPPIWSSARPASVSARDEHGKTRTKSWNTFISRRILFGMHIGRA